MTREVSHAKKLSALLKRLKPAHKPEPAPEQDPVTRLVIGFLEWNASRKAAIDAFARLMSVMVDANDLRVSHPQEIVALLGERYPHAEERAARLHESLQEIFVREHGMAIEHLSDKPKKTARAYLETLPGATPYVTAQVTLLSFGGHAIPVDDRIADLLRQAEVVEPNATVDEIGSFLERHIKAEDAADVHHALRAWAEGHSGRAAKPAKKKTAAKKPAKKTGKK